MKEVTIQNYNRIFWDIVSKYDVKNDNILRKIIHGYSVAEKCFTVASKLKLNKKQREFCYLLGLFNDIGRYLTLLFLFSKHTKILATKKHGVN